ncbi:MAG: hypothetical protein KKH04_12085 [Proteobacteria bacterium]|nr:hypothetical protein [Pseudomonadota bacterium]
MERLAQILQEVFPALFVVRECHTQAFYRALRLGDGLVVEKRLLVTHRGNSIQLRAGRFRPVLTALTRGARNMRAIPRGYCFRM